MNKCSFCGYTFGGKESLKACDGCPMTKTCNKFKCPNCGYEMLKEPGLVKLFKKWRKNNG